MQKVSYPPNTPRNLRLRDDKHGCEIKLLLLFVERRIKL